MKKKEEEKTNLIFDNYWGIIFWRKVVKLKEFCQSITVHPYTIPKVHMDVTNKKNNKSFKR